MRACIWSLAAIVVVIAPAASAQVDPVKRGPTPAWVQPSQPLAVPDKPSGAVFMRRQDIVVHVTPEGQQQYLGYRVKILQSSALQIGNLGLVWNPAAGSPMVHQITVYRDGQATDVLKGATFQILRREGNLEQAQLDGLLTATLQIPDLRVGDELEVGMTLPGADPTLGDRASGVLFLGPAPAAGRYRLALTWDAKSRLTVRPTADIAPRISAVGRSVELLIDNPDAAPPPKDAPPRYQWLRAIEYTGFDSWAGLSRHFAPLYAKASMLSPSSPIKAEAARIAASHATPMARAAAALKLVQQDVRYIYVGLNGGNLTPATAEQTWQRRYGDCKGKTALLLALLRELGIPAKAVLVNASGADDGLDRRLPGPQLFDHVLVRAQIDGAEYWMDGTLPPVAPPAARPVLPLRWVLPITVEGAAIESLPFATAAVPEEVNLYEIDARAGFDKPARITTTSIVRGMKGLEQQVQFSAVDKQQMLATFRQQLTGDTWQAIEEVDWRYDDKAGASVLRISGTGMVDWDDDAGEKSLALPGGGFNPPEKRIRLARQDGAEVPFYQAPDFSCHVTTVRLPTTTQPMQWSAKPSFDMRYFGRHYYRAFDLRDGAIRMIRASRVEQPEIDAATASQDNERLSKFDNSMGWITYDPANKAGKVGTGVPVPATYDRDWVDDDVPCMPKP